MNSSSTTRVFLKRRWGGIAMLRVLVTLALSIPLSLWAAPPVPIVNNGAAVEADLGLRYNYAQYTIYDQFVLSERTLLTGVGWSQFDEALTYSGSTISIYDGPPSETTLIASFDVVASRLPNGLTVVTDKAGPVTGYDYFATVKKNLGPGEYLIGIHNDVVDGQTLMANSRSTPQSVFGSYQTIGDRLEFHNVDFALRLFGK